jgi:hypothetical protein
MQIARLPTNQQEARRLQAALERRMACLVREIAECQQQVDSLEYLYPSPSGNGRDEPS